MARHQTRVMVRPSRLCPPRSNGREIDDGRESPAICSIGVVVTHLPSKQVSPVRIRHAAPHGLYLGAVESPSFNWLQGTDLPAGFTLPAVIRCSGSAHRLFTCCFPLGKAVRLCLAPPTTAEVVAFILTVGKDRPAGVVHASS